MRRADTWLKTACLLGVLLLFAGDAQAEWVRLHLKDDGSGRRVVEGNAVGFQNGNWMLKDVSGKDMTPVPDSLVRDVDMIKEPLPGQHGYNAPKPKPSVIPGAPPETVAAQLVNAGIELSRQGKFPEAIDKLTRALEQNQLYMPARYELIQVYLSQHALGAAQRELEWILSRDPHDLKALRLHVEYYRKLGQAMNMHEAEVKILQFSLPTPEAYYRITHYWLRHNFMTRAKQAWEHYKKIDPDRGGDYDDESALIRKADGLSQNGKMNPAIQLYFDAMKMNPVIREEMTSKILTLRRMRAQQYMTSDIAAAAREVLAMRKEVAEVGTDGEFLTKDILTEYIRDALKRGAAESLTDVLRQCEGVLPAKEMHIVWVETISRIDAMLDFNESLDPTLRVTDFVITRILNFEKRSTMVDELAANMLVHAARVLEKQDRFEEAQHYLRHAGTVDSSRRAEWAGTLIDLYHRRVEGVILRERGDFLDNTLTNAHKDLSRAHVHELYTFTVKMLERFVTDSGSAQFVRVAAKNVRARIMGDPEIPMAVRSALGSLYLAMADHAYSTGEFDSGMEYSELATELDEGHESRAQEMLDEFVHERLRGLARRGSLNRLANELVDTKYAMPPQHYLSVLGALIDECKLMADETPQSPHTDGLAEVLAAAVQADETYPQTIRRQVAEVFLLLGNRAKERQDLDVAARHFERARELEGGLTDEAVARQIQAHRAAAEKAILNGKPKEAMNHISLASQLSGPGDPWVARMAKEVDFQKVRLRIEATGDHAEKLRLVEQFLDLKPDLPDHVQWAKLLRAELLEKLEITQMDSTPSGSGEYFPLVVGATHTYQIGRNLSDGDKADVHTVQKITVDAMEDVEGKQSYTMRRRTIREGARNGVTDTYSILKVGGNIYLNRPGNQTLYLKMPFVVGEDWQVSRSAAVTVERRVLSMDDVVETPAGLFEDCMKIQTRSMAATRHGQEATEIVSFAYYAKGVGLVKIEYKDGQGEDVVLQEYVQK